MWLKLQRMQVLDGRPQGTALIGNSLALAVFGVVLLEQLFRNQGEASRWNAKPVCLALGFVFVFDVLLEYFPNFEDAKGLILTHS